jgi:hypothetical protein
VVVSLRFALSSWTTRPVLSSATSRDPVSTLRIPEAPRPLSSRNKWDSREGEKEEPRNQHIAWKGSTDICASTSPRG